MRFLLTLTTISLALLSCQTATVQHGNVAVQYSSYSSNIGPGFRLKLNKALIIPGETASLHIQDGEPRPQQLNPVENYRPYCIIEVRNRVAATQTIKPGIFYVSRVFLKEEVVSLLPKFASLTRSASSTGLHLGSGGHTAVAYITEMYLESESQPEVVRLICKQWDDPALGEHLTLRDITLALGELITILPESSESKVSN